MTTIAESTTSALSVRDKELPTTDDAQRTHDEEP